MNKKLNEARFAYCQNADDNTELYDAFQAGAEWQQKEFESIEQLTERNMNVIGSFIEHLKQNKINVPEKHVLSFFNA